MRGYLLLAMLLFAPTLGASPAASETADEVMNDPLRWDDLVVRGTVQSITYSTVPPEEWYPPELLRFQSDRVQLAVLTISVGETLRGDPSLSEMVIYARRPATAYSELILKSRVVVGTEIIAACLYRPERGIYVLHSVFAEVGSGWSRLREDAWDTPIDGKEIRARVASVGVKSMTQESDLVVGVTVVSSGALDVNTGEREYVVAPYVTLKGAPQQSLRVRTRLSPELNASAWRKVLPFDLTEGLAWYLFLQKDNEYYVPTAGRRSAIRVVGSDLFENLNVPSTLRVESLEREIRAVAAE